MKVSTEGDIGDVIYLMCVLSQLRAPEGIELLVEPTKVCKHKEDVNKLLNPIKELVESQPYIKECRAMRPGEEETIQWRSGKFRQDGLYRPYLSLAQIHYNHYIFDGNDPIDFRTDIPWLTVDPNKELEGCVVINRTERYNNNNFRWKEVMDFYDKKVFIGTKNEHSEFQSKFGSIERYPTENMLDVAGAIAGCYWFYGNQSSCFAIAEGLKQNRTLEVSVNQPDCLYKGGRVYHSYDGSLVMSKEENGVTVEKGGIVDISQISLNITPPGGWRSKVDNSRHVSFDNCLRHELSLLSPQWKNTNERIDGIKRDLILHNVNAIPNWNWSPNQYIRVHRAMKEAGI